MWDTFIVNPIFNFLLFLYRTLGDLGLALIVFTVIVKVLQLPLTIPSLKMSTKQRDLQPELKALKEKFKYDKKKQAEMQMELFKKHGVNPGMGCATTIVTLVIMFAVYRSVSMLTYGTDVISAKGATPDLSRLNARVFISSLAFQPGETIKHVSLGIDLTKPAIALTIFATAIQFLMTKMMLPYSEAEKKATEKTPGEVDDMMAAMQKQNLYIMPLMFLVFGFVLPSGVMVYIIMSTILQMVQTYFFSGWGGLKPWINRLRYAKR